MAESKIAGAFVEISAKQTRLEADLTKARAKVEGFASFSRNKMSGIGDAFGKVFSGFAGGLGIGGGLSAFSSVAGMIETITQATIREESSQTKLRATLRATGNEIDGNAASINKLAEAMQEKLNVDDEATRTLASYALNLGVGTDQVNAYTKAAVGLAEATGGDAAGAMESLVKASQGSFKALQKQLPLLKTMNTAEEKFAYISKLANQGLDEKAASLNTVGGSTEQLRLATNELSKALGAQLGPALVNATRDMTVLVNATNRMITKSFFLSSVFSSLNAAMAHFNGAGYEAANAQKELDDAVKLGSGDLKKQGDELDRLKNKFSGIEDVWSKAQEAIFGGEAGGAGGIAEKIAAATQPTTQPADRKFLRTFQGPLFSEAINTPERELARRLSDRSQYSQNRPGASNDPALVAFQQQNEARIIALQNQLKSEGGPEAGVARRGMALLNDRLAEAVRSERTNPGDAEKIYDKRRDAETQTLAQLNQTLQKMATYGPQLIRVIQSAGGLR